MEAGPIVAIVGTSITVLSLLAGIVWKLATLSTTLTKFVESMEATMKRAEKEHESVWTEIGHQRERESDVRSQLARIDAVLSIRRGAGDDKRQS